MVTLDTLCCVFELIVNRKEEKKLLLQCCNDINCIAELCKIDSSAHMLVMLCPFILDLFQWL